MQLSRIQKIGLVFFICSLVPAYFISQWQYDGNLSAITEQFEREQALHLSTDKLLDNCERLKEKANASYDARHQICAQGTQEHSQVTQAMDDLAQKKIQNDTQWYRNFFVIVLLLNGLGALGYKAYQLLIRSEN